MTDCKTIIDTLPHLPPSAEKVLCNMTAGPVTGKNLQEQTGLPRRTVYAALSKLRDLGILKEQLSLKDSRQTYFWLNVA